MLMNYAMYRERADRLAFHNTDPSETDQSGGDDTDVNVIVKRYGVYGTVPSGMKQPQFGMDMSEIPLDLRDMIESARSLERLRGELPESLRALNVEDLITMTPEAIAGILNPPIPAEPKEPA